MTTISAQAETPVLSCDPYHSRDRQLIDFISENGLRVYISPVEGIVPELRIGQRIIRTHPEIYQYLKEHAGF